MALEPPPPWIRRWPRNVRVGLVWTAVAFTVLVGGPAAVTGIFLLWFHLDQCPVVVCSAGFRAIVAITTLAIILPVVWRWSWFLQRVLSYRDANDDSDNRNELPP